MIVNYVVNIALHSSVRLNCLIYIVRKLSIFNIRKVLNAKECLCLFCSVRSENSIVGLFVNDIVRVNVIIAGLAVHLLDNVFTKLSREGIGSVIHLGGFFTSARNYQGGSCLIHKNRVNLVDYSKIVASLHKVFLVHYHIVAQIVKSKFVVRSVGYIRIVGLFLLRGCKSVYNKSRSKPHKLIYSPHFLAIASCKIVVYGNYVHTLARKSVKIGGHCCDKSFSFSCFHLCDSALMEYYSTYKLYSEGTLPENSVVCLSDSGKSVRQNIIKIFTARKSFLKYSGRIRKLLIAH